MSTKKAPVTVKAIICRGIQEELEISAIVKRVRAKIPESRVNKGQINVYVNFLFKQGIIDAEHKAKYVGKRGRPEVIIEKLERPTITEKLISHQSMGGSNGKGTIVNRM